MNALKKIIFITFTISFSLLSSASVDFSGDSCDSKMTQAQKKENLLRTKTLVSSVEQYMKDNNVMVAMISRRGKVVDPNKGISDVDEYDSTGTAHTGFVVRRAFAGENQFVTYNLVRIKGKHYDTSDLRIWSLEQFFIGSGEKDAIIMVLEKDLQAKLWNKLISGTKIEVKEVKVCGNTVERLNISGGMFEQLHIEKYSLLSDYANNKTQNCNEHLIKNIVESKYGIQDPQEIQTLIEKEYSPYRFWIPRWKRWAANAIMGLNISRFERYHKGRETLLVVTVESLVSPENSEFLGIEKVQVFREGEDKNGNYVIEDHGSETNKRNTASGRLNNTNKLFKELLIN